MLTALIILLLMGAIIFGATEGPRWIEQRREDRQAALQAEMQAMLVAQRLSFLAWQTRIAMHQAVTEKRNSKAS
jgi:hypothetical protein